MARDKKAIKAAKNSLRAKKAWVTKHEKTLLLLMEGDPLETTLGHFQSVTTAWETFSLSIDKFVEEVNTFKQSITNQSEIDNCDEQIDYMVLKRKDRKQSYGSYILACENVLSQSHPPQIIMQKMPTDQIRDPSKETPKTSHLANLSQSDFELFENEVSLAKLEEEEAKLKLLAIQAENEAKAKLLLSQRRTLQAKARLMTVKNEQYTMTTATPSFFPIKQPDLGNDESFIGLPNARQVNENASTSRAQNDVINAQKAPVLQPKPPEVGLIDYAVLQQGLGLTNFRVEDKFDGSELAYFQFIDNFERTTAPLQGRPALMLHILANSCTGRAKRVVDQCAKHGDPLEALTAALTELKLNFGQPEILRSVHLTKVTQGPPITNDAGSLMDFLTDLKGCRTVLTRFGHIHDLNSVSTTTSIFDRLPFHIRTRFVQKTGKNHNPDFDFLITFLEEQVRLANNVFGRRLKSTNKKQSRDAKVNVADTEVKTSYDKPKNGKCICCGEQGHYINQCKTFISKSAADRMTIVKRKHACYNCMGLHPGKSCKSKFRCKVQGCRARHHTLLHEAFTHAEASIAETDEPARVSDNAAINQPIRRCKNARVPVIALKAFNLHGGKKVDVYALLDSGADSSLCTHALANKLGVAGTPCVLSLDGVLSQAKNMQARELTFFVESQDGNLCVQLSDVLCIDHLPKHTRSIPAHCDIAANPHLKGLIHTPLVKHSQVDLIIGMDYEQMHDVISCVYGPIGKLSAKQYPLSWALSSETRLSDTATLSATVCAYQRTDHTDLQKLITDMFNRNFVEMPGDDQIVMSVEDKRAISLLENSITQRPDGHLEIGFPFKHDNVVLPNNYPMAIQRFENLRNQLRKNPEMWNHTKNIIQGMRERNNIRLTTLSELEQECFSTKTWYLPYRLTHIEVKPRVIFDARATYKNTSINKVLLQGPALIQTKMISILLRARQYPICVQADIEKMFNQCKLTKEDQSNLRMLWFENDDVSGRAVSHSFDFHAYGLMSSPNVAEFSIQEVGRLNKTNASPTTIQILKNSFWVDDLVKGFQNFPDAKSLMFELIKLLASCKFNLRKFATNCPELQNCFPKCDWAPAIQELDLDHDSLPVQKTLGVQWDTQKDVYRVSFKLMHKPRTKRGLLSMLHSIYDPFGFCCLFVLPAKIILQKLNLLHLT